MVKVKLMWLHMLPWCSLFLVRPVTQALLRRSLQMCPRTGRHIRPVIQDDQDAIIPLVPDEQSSRPPYDAIIIGGGISGVFVCAEAVQQGITNVMVLEKQHRVGGIWTHLPSWQTVQNDPLDFCVQGFTTQKKVWNTKDVVHMLEEYVKVQKLQPYIHLGREVYTQEWSEAEGVWILKVHVSNKDGTMSPVQETYRCKKLVLCTGKHASPNVPTIPKDDNSVPVVHSSEVHDWTKYQGKRVVVVGAGASGLDLIINTLKTNRDAEAGTRGHKVHWVVREPKFFGALGYRDVFALTIFQLLFGTLGTTIVSFLLNYFSRLVFRKMKLEHWIPERKFDLSRDQVIPSRGYVVHNSHRVNRVGGVEIAEVRNRRVKLTDGTVIEDVDAILMGTGYRSPNHQANLELDKSTPVYLKAIPINRHKGRLFLFGETLLDSTGSTPMSVHVIARKFWNLLLEDKFDSMKMDPHLIFDLDVNVNHLDTLNYVAPISRDFLPFFIWRWRMLAIHSYYRYRYNTRVFYADRVLGYNMSLDD